MTALAKVFYLLVETGSMFHYSGVIADLASCSAPASISKVSCKSSYGLFLLTTLRFGFRS